MRSDWLAQALLRLYPRAWRDRYGDEFLALVDESGLSWRAVADVVAAAGAEHVQAVTALVGHEADPTAPVPLAASRPFREVLAEGGAFMGLVCLTVWALVALGVPSPSWTWWLCAYGPWDNRNLVPTATPASWSERAVASFFWCAAAVLLTGLGWLAGGTLGRLGVPEPSDRTFFWILGTFLAAGTLRIVYCGVRALVYGSTWPGMHRLEIHAWHLAKLLVIVVVALADPSGVLFWGVMMLLWMSLRPPFWVTRAGAANCRARYEEMESRFSSGSDSAQPPTLA